MKEIKCLSIGFFCIFLLCILFQAEAQQEMAERVMDTTGVRGGLVVHVGCGDGKLTAALRVNDRYIVHGLDADANNIRRARQHIQSLGIYGVVSAEQLNGNRLPYTDNLVNLIVSEDLGQVPMSEVIRVLVPNGMAYIKKDDRWVKTVKPWPEEIDEWTHYLHDASGNAVAKDTRVGPPKYMQWLANPLYSRSHEIDTSVSALVSANGRIFYILDEGLTGVTDERLPEKWALVARDAFNGVLLWKRPLPQWGWPEWKKEVLAGKDWTGLRGQRTSSPAALPRRLVASEDRVYVTLGYTAPVTALDAATGEVIRSYEGTEETDEILYNDGILAVCIRKEAVEEAARRGEAIPESIIALKADTGETLWQKQESRILPLSLSVEGERVFFHNYKETVALNLRTGQELWRTASEGPKAGRWVPNATLVAHDGVVLLTYPGKLEALSAETGEVLWTGPGGSGPGVSNPPDLFVAAGLVWSGKSTDGVDLMTGETKKTIELQNLITQGHHFRCYRSKATERYLLWPKRGVEFIDLVSEDHERNDWLRAPCKLGTMPCNGLLYVAPHQCFCYPGVKLAGFNALASQRESGIESSVVRLERGSAYGQVEASEPETGVLNNWPTYRHDARRSGSTAFSVPVDMQRLWKADLGGRITQPVVAHGKLFIAAVNTHTVSCLDANNGKTLWSYTTGGCVDSPPTIHKGAALFGSADGWVYCLRSSDGELIWRFRAAPEERRVVAFSQLESAWPVHGSVLIKDDVAYFAAGRSSYLDGGIYLYGLDPVSGELLHEARLDGPHPDIANDPGRPFDMEGAMSDVLVTDNDGEFLYMYQTMFDGKLEQKEAPRITKMGDRKMGRHIFSTAGFLDDSWWNRTFWMYSEMWPGYYIANQAPKAGQLLVFDGATTYGVKCYTRRNRHSPMFFPGKEGYLLFADDNDNEPVLVDETGNPQPVKWLPDVNEAIGHKLEGTAVDKDKGTGFTRAQPPKWSVWVPVRIRAMVLAGETLFAAGPPDVLDPDDPLAAFEGRKGATLWAISTEDGKKLTEQKLASPPIFDGMIAADGRLYIAMTDGSLLCFGAGQ